MINRTWRAAACAFALAAFAQAQQPASAAGEKKQFTVEQMFAERGASERPPSGLQWSPDGTKLTYIEHGAGGEQEALYYFDPASGKSSVLIAADKLSSLVPSTSKLKDDRQRENRSRFGVADYLWAPDSKSLLFDALGQLWIYDLAAGRGRQVTTSDEPSTDPKFSPDGKHVSFVREHNLFIRPLGAEKEVQLTRTTDPNLMNGEVDWVYSEELDVRSNYFWSPDSREILYLQMNEAPVPQYPIVNWMPTHPTTDQERYPKAGDPNPTVKLAVTDLQGHTRWLDFFKGADYYVPRFGWVRPGLAWAMVLNRNQNQQDLYFIDTKSGKSRRVLSETDPNYIELHSPMGRDRHQGLRFFDKSNRFLWLSWRDGFTHAYVYSFDANAPLAADAKLERQLERGDYEVSDIVGVDEAKGLVYLDASKDDDRQDHLYSVSVNGGELTQLTKPHGVHDAKLSETGEYFVDSYSSLAQQPKMQICAVSGSCHEIWASHAWDGFDVIQPQFVDFKAEDGQVLHGVLILPRPGSAAEVNGKVPLILNPYGGPHGQSVRDSSTAINAFDEILAHKGYAVLKVDNRGMGNRGRKFAMPTYKHLGEVELKDQLAALDQALEKFPNLDRDRLGWWGWSYGGTITAYALTHSDRFKAGVAVAPVTDWHNYDSIYTERYMGLPKDNAQGYEKDSVVKAAGALKGRLLLVHGTSDDNVHMQNSIQFINAMINAGVPFDLQMYPGKTHGIAGQQARTHLYNRMLWHWDHYLLHPETTTK